VSPDLDALGLNWRACVLGSLLAQPKVSPEVSPEVSQSGPTLVHAKTNETIECTHHCVTISTAQCCTSIALISHFPKITTTNNKQQLLLHTKQ